MAGVTVILADDHPVFRDGLVGLLEGAASTCWRPWRTAARRVDAIRAHRPQVAIIDLQLPDIDGETVIDIVRREHLPTRILVLSARSDSAVVYRCIELGAAGYLPKLTAGDDICAAVARARARRERRARRVAGGPRERDPPAPQRRPARCSRRASSTSSASRPTATRTPRSACGCTSARRR